MPSEYWYIISVSMILRVLQSSENQKINKIQDLKLTLNFKIWVRGRLWII